jgi:hypothetical protein
MEQLLKQKLREQPDRSDSLEEKNVREESICVDMDFAENYEIIHSIEIQSDHWQHQQVTLYIVITHFKVKAAWTSEAHIFVSSDRSHDTFFVQRAMTGFFSLFTSVCIPSSLHIFCLVYQMLLCEWYIFTMFFLCSPH